MVRLVAPLPFFEDLINQCANSGSLELRVSGEERSLLTFDNSYVADWNGLLPQKARKMCMPIWMYPHLVLMLLRPK